MLSYNNKLHINFTRHAITIFCHIRAFHPQSDSSEDSVFSNQACAPRTSGRIKKMAAVFNREASFDDNRSDVYDDDEDRGFFHMNESDEGII